MQCSTGPNTSGPQDFGSRYYESGAVVAAFGSGNNRFCQRGAVDAGAELDLIAAVPSRNEGLISAPDCNEFQVDFAL